MVRLHAKKAFKRAKSEAIKYTKKRGATIFRKICEKEISRDKR